MAGLEAHYAESGIEARILAGLRATDWLPFTPPRWLPIPRHSQIDRIFPQATDDHGYFAYLIHTVLFYGQFALGANAV